MEWVVSITLWSLYVRERDPASVVRKTGWAPGPVWTGEENLTPTENRSPYHPARSESLYRLSCSGFRVQIVPLSLSSAMFPAEPRPSSPFFLHSVCFTGTIFRYFSSSLVTIPVDPGTTGTIKYFMFHTR